jgi:hypothetical protein
MAMPFPRLVEIDTVDLALPVEEAYAIVRHQSLGQSALIRSLFRLRTLPERWFSSSGSSSSNSGSPGAPVALRLDALHSSPEKPGFQILAEDEPREVVVGAIGKVWHLDIPFVHVASILDFRYFDAPDFIKVAWAIRVDPIGEDENACRLSIEVRVDATDDDAFSKFRVYFGVIGPASHLIRRSLLGHLASEYGTPESKKEQRPLPGDELLAETGVTEQVTHDITIDAPPEKIWPWLVQMGCRRGGFYSYDILDNGGERSAREIHEELQNIKVGQVLPATPKGKDGFEVLAILPNHALVLGGLYDLEEGHQLPFRNTPVEEEPAHCWRVTWAFVLERLSEKKTKLHVRARVFFPSTSRTARMHSVWIRFVHQFMQRKQLHELAALVESRAPREDWRDVVDGSAGVARIVAAFLTPFLREGRSHWGVDEEYATKRAFPGDDLVPLPRWSWTHGIEINASADEVWPWIAQIGQEHAGFYSYQWIENLAGCEIRNAETIHKEWEIHDGEGLRLHPKMPPLPIVEIIPQRGFVAFAPADLAAKMNGKPWVSVSWLFYLEPIDDDDNKNGRRRCRFVSRYRCACSDDLVTQLSYGPTLMEPVGFAMDRRMLEGVKERVEKTLK